MALKVLSALDVAKTQYYHFKAIIIAGMGLFTDSYDLFCIPLIMRMIGRIYYPTVDKTVDPKKWFEVPTVIASTMFCVALMGAVIGQLVFGRLGDRVGRRRVYGVSLIMMVVGSIGCGLSLSSLTSMVFVSLGFFRFLLGMGIGGDYPLSATIMAEFANKRTRGTFIAGVFSMQGFGILLSSLVSMIVCSIFEASANKHNLEKPSELAPLVNIAPVPPESDLAWRLILMIGAIPASMTYYWRMKMPETARFTALVENNALQAAKDIGKVMNVPLSTIQEDVEMINTPNTRAALSNTYPFFSREFLRRHGRDLIAASINWLLIDIVFYSLNLFQYHAFRGLMKSKININLYQDAMQIAKYQALIAICATIPGYIVTVYMIDRVGRVKIQAAGFFFMAISLFTIAKVNKGGSNQGPGFIILYGLTFFFSNFGPNTTTFIVPAELFPARFRATCHGISGAVGKLGAIIGLIGFILASREQPKDMGRSLEENENVDELTGVWFVRFWPHKVWDKRNEVNTGERMSLY
ncbi:putative major facilitator, sugar transporter, major facilitator superfamily [Helianthus annuus]|nr:putative major facilitator, sugar transporter, major facilitator superfamily [Helianthus annuus]